MDTTTLVIILHLCGVFLCLMAIAFFSMSESAMVATNQMRLRVLADEGDADDRNLAAAHHISRESQRYLASVIIGTNIPILFASALMTHLVRNVLHREDLLGWKTLGMIGVILFFCEIAPKTYTVHNAERVALRTARMARIALTLLQPLTVVTMFISNGIIRLAGGQRHMGRDSVSEDELKQLVELGEEEGILEEPETRLLENIFDMGERIAREIMVPRPDMVCLPANCTWGEALDTIESSGLSRIPIYEETPDNIIGVIYVKDLVTELEARMRGEAARPPRALARSVLYVPETRKIDDLFRDLRAQKAQMAIVIDEHGGTAGLVTMEDILEELVGEIMDEYDLEETKVQRIAENTFLVDARIDVDSVQQEMGIRLPEGDFDTLAGFICDQVGKVPVPGEKVETNDAVFIVQQVRRHRVTRVRVVRKASSGESEQ